MSEVTPFGDRALRFALSSSLDRRGLLTRIRAIAGVDDVVLAETVGAAVLAPGASLGEVGTRVEEALAAASSGAPSEASSGASSGASHPAHEPASAPALHTLRVVYGGADLASVASQLGLTPEAVIALHSAPEYEVAMLGFMPGFAYLRGLDPRLVVARRAEPRPRVPAGSVAIAAEYTGVYPFASPGGWNLLGEALDPRLLDEGGARLSVGDRVRFEPTERRAHVMSQTNTSRVAAVAPRGVHLDVRKAQGPALVIDAGRPGHMHEGVPHGGAMIPEALARANSAAGNEPGAAGFEVYGAFEVVARGGRITVADDTGHARQLADGESFGVATEGRTRVRYLAMRGGVDVRVVLGGRGTMLSVRMGGLDGRPLKRGDLLGVGKQHATAAAGASPSPSPSPSPSGGVSAEPPVDEIAIDPGPDLDAALLDAVLAASFTIGAASDRVGTRLEGSALPAHSMQHARDRKSTPMVAGAIEVTPAGLVVLGPDHPTTGGYPVIGVVRSASLGALFARPIGASVRLVIHRRSGT